MKSKIKTAILGIFLLSGVFLQPVYVNGADGLRVCGGSENISAGATDSSFCQLQDIFKLIAKITNYLIGAAGLFAIVMIVVSGVRLITSIGNDSEVKKGKKGLTNAIIGFVLVLIAYLVINTIFVAIVSQKGYTDFKINYLPWGN